MNDLLRELAPISALGWERIERDVRDVLKVRLAGRKLVDFSGPHGWSASSISLGRADDIGDAPAPGVRIARRRVRPLIELWAEFELDRSELDALDRGDSKPNLDPARDAAVRIAAAEDRAIFHGYPAAEVRGIMEATTHESLAIGDDYTDYPRLVAEAMRLLHDEGVGGPIGIALGPRCFTGLMQAIEGGYPVYEHVRKLVDGPVVSAPSVDGAVVMSVRGSDFELTVGRDLSLGYRGHTAEKVALYLVESITFRVLTPEAAVALVYES